MGKTFKELGIKIDGVFSSAFKRALRSASYFREGYSEESLPIKLMVKLHEKGGCQIKGQCKPGLNREQALQYVPDLQITDDQAIDEVGWWKNETVETTEQCIARIKELMKDFKELYKSNREAYQGKTFICISHGTFLNNLACVFTNNIGNAH